jgi:hypothetical protein
MDAALRKDILTKKITKSGGFETRPYIFLRLCIAMHKSLRTLRKFSGGRGYPKRGFDRAKTPRTPSPEV